MKKQFVQRLMLLAVVAMASMSCFAQGKGGEATGWTATQFGPNYQELSYSVETNTVYHEAIVTGFASYVVETPAIMDDPETYAPSDPNLHIEKNTIIINHYMKGGSSLDVYIPSIADNAFASVASDLASKIKKIKIDFKEASESEDNTDDIPVKIGENAFAGLTSVDTVFCYTPGEFVKDIPTDAFAASVYKTAKLRVPEGSLLDYAKTEGWNKFYLKTDGSITLGDPSGDGKINASDVKAIRALIVNKTYSVAADLNGDNKVNASDLKIMRQIIVKTY